ncbi:retinoschisin-like [Porites lutea]|uniref:retinoschisin-like n=1 Tax=Porites lutea TaxID=51062 RepID=UPI003CC523D3
MMRNNDWYTPGWKLLKVTIRIQGHSDLYTFYFNKWLSANKEVTLHEENKCRSGHSDCQHLCIYTNPGFRCDCHPGFELHQMNRCKDVDECKNGDNKCDLKAAHCVNKPGSYSCQCKEGYQQMDNNTCTAFTSSKMCSGSDALGMESGKIKNQSITASSYYPQYPPWAARLRSGIAKGWYAFPYDPLPWIQVDLGKQTWLKGVATQGKMFSMYVTSYKLAYSQDQVTWFYYRGDSDNDKVLNGNKDPYRVVTNSLPRPIHTRFVRLYPLSWNDALVMKLELYGCISS